MKTYPINRDDGTLHAFEIGNTWISIHAIKKILNSIAEVKSIKRPFNSDIRIEFIFNDEPWVVWEPWGDSSRYWIGPKNPDNHPFDVTPINDAFANYQSPVSRLWAIIKQHNS